MPCWPHRSGVVALGLRGVDMSLQAPRLTHGCRTCRRPDALLVALPDSDDDDADKEEQLLAVRLPRRCAGPPGSETAGCWTGCVYHAADMRACSWILPGVALAAHSAQVHSMHVPSDTRHCIVSCNDTVCVQAIQNWPCSPIQRCRKREIERTSWLVLSNMCLGAG